MDQPSININNYPHGSGMRGAPGGAADQRMHPHRIDRIDFNWNFNGIVSSLSWLTRRWFVCIDWIYFLLSAAEEFQLISCNQPNELIKLMDNQLIARFRWSIPAVGRRVPMRSARWRWRRRSGMEASNLNGRRRRRRRGLNFTCDSSMEDFISWFQRLQIVSEKS